jgi:acyl transferase domain-containing protein
MAYAMHGANEIARVGQNSAHPFLGVHVAGAVEVDAVHETVISLSEHPWLADHRLGDLVILPGAAVAELVRAAAESHLGSTPEIRGLVLISPIVLQDLQAGHVRVVIARNRTRASVYCHSTEAPGASWVRCAVAHISPCRLGVRPDRVDIEALRKRCNNSVNVASLYEGFAAAGFLYGPAFRGLRTLACGAGEALGDIQLPEDEDARGYGLHPALLDAALHVMAGAAPAGGREAWVPFEIGLFIVYDTDRREALVHAQFVSGAANTRIVDITIMDPDGTVIAVMSSLAIRRADVLMKLGQTLLYRDAADLPPQIDDA